jgi:hypothetical protein
VETATSGVLTTLFTPARFGRRGTKKLSHRVAAIASISGITLVVAITPAQAASHDWSCPAGGFTGTSRLNYTLINSLTLRVDSWQNKINKSTNSGGNSADVTWVDASTVPNPSGGTGAGIQNNAFHTLGQHGYLRTRNMGGSGATSFKFIFDKVARRRPVLSFSHQWHPLDHRHRLHAGAPPSAGARLAWSGTSQAGTETAP